MKVVDDYDSKRMEHRFTAHVSNTELALLTSPEMILNDVRYSIVQAITKVVMDRLEPVLAEALKAMAPSAGEGE